MAVRLARAKDIPTLVRFFEALHREQQPYDARAQPVPGAAKLFERELQEGLQGPYRALWLALEAEEPVGFLHGLLVRRPPVWGEALMGFIQELYVEPAHRRRGHGRALVEAFCAWARTRGAHQVELNTLYRNPHSRAFWEALGGEPFLVTYTLPLK
ncbi:MAG: GNAT family N-acetyltransferase [Bacteroidetes bacterium]|nr:GNAT family N-acetyltransferase [Rhodothermia bacterium]MCS7156016.1 GNAT family N-acetyltransferase [Bacteroidota bacterium]MCX7907704.1 GNAT family N-acetyltransferase [Bacteroidota bacterium]MDW8137833.1 GNAT family N-acetyltransferase [Bacteroidota bacterium]MDW8286316.1 GNAT family N-acetyltransferase [Bacteroidota bacterium]